MLSSGFRCVVHGSLRKHIHEMGDAIEIFRSAGIDVLAPHMTDFVREDDGFLFFRGEERTDPRLIELLYLQNLRNLGKNGFSFFVNPGGYIGKSVSYELGIAQATNVPCFFTNRLADHPAYIGEQSVWSATSLADYITKYRTLPTIMTRNETAIAKLWRQLLVPGSVISAGAIIEYTDEKSRRENEILLVRTHKWRNRFSIVGGKVRRGEHLVDALKREVATETGLDGAVREHLCTFDEIASAGYCGENISRVFVDNVVRVNRKTVTLNDEAEDYMWIPARHALRELDIEPNARHTIEHYVTLRSY